ncbi:hypothetical protein [Paenibacillus sp. Pae108]|uniref:hypothetical protein n=1 Tax=Paenibacillus sp. Pae108 TaxID=2926019 RepID=UPI0021177C07|nr:hypothetical protein [Paenibacillus sp. Pae108]
MKNVMVRAWEIAKAAVVKFGGKVREYLASALRQAWSEAKNSSQFGFVVIQKLNGMLYFGADADVEIAYYTQDRNRFGKLYTKRHVLTPYLTGTNKATGKAANLYRVSLGMYELDFAGKATLEINRGLLKWVAH